MSYCARSRWRDQARPERGDDLQEMLLLFRGLTLQERDEEPPPSFTAEERRALFTTCGTLVLHWCAHKIGALHSERKSRAKRMMGAAGAAAACSVSRPLPASSGLHAGLEEAAVRVLLASRPGLLQECPVSLGLPSGQSEFLVTHLKAPDPAPRGLRPPSRTAGQPASTPPPPAMVPEDNPGCTLEASTLTLKDESDMELSGEAAEQLLFVQAREV